MSALVSHSLKPAVPGGDVNDSGCADDCAMMRGPVRRVLTDRGNFHEPQPSFPLRERRDACSLRPPINVTWVGGGSGEAGGGDGGNGLACVPTWDTWDCWTDSVGMRVYCWQLIKFVS